MSCEWRKISWFLCNSITIRFFRRTMDQKGNFLAKNTFRMKLAYFGIKYGFFWVPDSKSGIKICLARTHAMNVHARALFLNIFTSHIMLMWFYKSWNWYLMLIFKYHDCNSYLISFPKSGSRSNETRIRIWPKLNLDLTKIESGFYQNWIRILPKLNPDLTK